MFIVYCVRMSQNVQVEVRAHRVGLGSLFHHGHRTQFIGLGGKQVCPMPCQQDVNHIVKEESCQVWWHTTHTEETSATSTKTPQ